jgi:hypothetical protein
VCHAYARTRESEIDAMIFLCHVMYFSRYFYGTVFVEFEQSSVIEFEIRAYKEVWPIMNRDMVF